MRVDRIVFLPVMRKEGKAFRMKFQISPRAGDPFET